MMAPFEAQVRERLDGFVFGADHASLQAPFTSCCRRAARRSPWQSRAPVDVSPQR